MPEPTENDNVPVDRGAHVADLEAPVVLAIENQEQGEAPALPEMSYRPYQQSSLFDMVQIALNGRDDLLSLRAIERQCQSSNTAETAPVLKIVKTLITIFEKCEAVSKILSDGKKPSAWDKAKLITIGNPLLQLLKQADSQLMALARNPKVSPMHKAFFSLLLAIIQKAPRQPNDFQKNLIPFVNQDFLASAFKKLNQLGHLPFGTIEGAERSYQEYLGNYVMLTSGYLATLDILQGNSPSITPPTPVFAPEPQDVPEVIDDSLAIRLETFRNLHSENEVVMTNTVVECSTLSATLDTLEHAIETQLHESFKKKRELSTYVLNTLPKLCKLAGVVITAQELAELEVLNTAAMLPNAANDALVLEILQRIKCSAFLRNVYDILTDKATRNVFEFFARIKALDPGDEESRDHNYSRLVHHLFHIEGLPLSESTQKLLDLDKWILFPPSNEKIEVTKLWILEKLCMQYPVIALSKKIESAIKLHRAEDIELASANRDYADIESTLAYKKTVSETAINNQGAYPAIIEALEVAERLEHESNFLNINFVTALIEKLDILASLEARSPELAEQVKQTQIKCDAVLASCLKKAVNRFDVMLPAVVCKDADYVAPYLSYLNNATLVGWINSRAPSISAHARDFIPFTKSRDVLLKKISPPVNVHAVIEPEKNASTCYNFFLKVMAQPTHKKIAIGLVIVGVLALIASGSGIGLIAGAGISIGVSLLTAEIVAGAGAAGCVFGGALGFFGGSKSKGAPPAVTVAPEAPAAP